MFAFESSWADPGGGGTNSKGDTIFSNFPKRLHKIETILDRRFSNGHGFKTESKTMAYVTFSVANVTFLKWQRLHVLLSDRL